MLDHEKRINHGIRTTSQRSLPFRSPSSSSAHQFQVPRAIIGRSFGPFSRCASLQSQTLLQRQKSFAEDVLGGECAKLFSLTSKADTHTVVDSSPVPISVPTVITGDKVAKHELKEPPNNILVVNNRTVVDGPKINSYSSTTIKTKARNSQPPGTTASSDYKFLRRQFSMDHKCLKQQGFRIGPAGCSLRWTASGGGSVGNNKWNRRSHPLEDDIKEVTVKEEERSRIDQINIPAPVGSATEAVGEPNER